MGMLSLIPSRSIRGQKQAANEFFIIGRVGKIPMIFGKSRLLTISEGCSATEAARIQLNDPVSLYSDNVSEHVDERDCASDEQILDFKDLSDQSAGGVSPNLFQSLNSNSDADKSYKLCSSQ